MNKKKIKMILGVIIFIIVGFLIAINTLINNKEEEITNFKVAGITKSPLYLPLFVGIEKGYFKDLKVEYVNTTGGDIANTMLLSGKINVALNSLNIVLTNVKEADRPVAIGEMTKRGGITLVSKNDIEDIRTIVSAKQGGLPNMILQNSTDYKIVANLSPQEGVTYFLNQDADAIMAFEPFATNLKNKGYKTKSMNDLYDDIPFNCVLVMEKNINKKEYKIFLEGLIKATEYIYNNDSKEIANLVKDIMDYKDEELLSEIIETFKKDEVYSSSYKLSEKEYKYYLDFTNTKEVKYELVYKNIL